MWWHFSNCLWLRYHEEIIEKERERELEMFLLVYVRDESTDQRFDKRVAERGIEQLLIITRARAWSVDLTRRNRLFKRRNRERKLIPIVDPFV